MRKHLIISVFLNGDDLEGQVPCREVIVAVDEIPDNLRHALAHGSVFKVNDQEVQEPQMALPIEVVTT